MATDQEYRQKMNACRQESGTLLQYDSAVYFGDLPGCGQKISGILEFRSRGVLFFSAAERFLLHIPGGEVTGADPRAWAEIGMPAPTDRETGVLVITRTGAAGEESLAFEVEWPEVLAEGVKKIRDDHQKMASAVSNSPDVFGRLKKIAELRDAGVLTEAEFNAQKTKLLKRI